MTSENFAAVLARSESLNILHAPRGGTPRTAVAGAAAVHGASRCMTGRGSVSLESRGVLCHAS